MTDNVKPLTLKERHAVLDGLIAALDALEAPDTPDFTRDPERGPRGFVWALAGIALVWLGGALAVWVLL